MTNTLPFLPIELQNIIFSYTRPVYPYIKELKEKVEKYIDFHKGFSETLLLWAEDTDDEEEIEDDLRLYKETLEIIKLNVNLRPYYYNRK